MPSCLASLAQHYVCESHHVTACSCGLVMLIAYVVLRCASVCNLVTHLILTDFWVVASVLLLQVVWVLTFLLMSFSIHIISIE